MYRLTDVDGSRPIAIWVRQIDDTRFECVDDTPDATHLLVVLSPFRVGEYELVWCETSTLSQCAELLTDIRKQGFQTIEDGDRWAVLLKRTYDVAKEFWGRYGQEPETVWLSQPADLIEPE